MRILSGLLKLFLPTPSKMAELAAERIADSVNRSELKDNVAKYAAMSKKATEMADWLAGILQNGVIDEFERDELAKVLLPLFERVVELI